MRTSRFKNYFHRPCKRCGERFQPTGPHNRICDECWGTASKRGGIK